MDIIFKDESSTLNKVVPDLWPIIKEYHRTFPKFIIGPYNAYYSDYYLITKNDFKDPLFVKSLIDFYQNNKGFPSLEDFMGNVLFGMDLIIHIDGYWLRLNSVFGDNTIIKKWSLYPFRTINDDYEHVLYNITHIDMCSGDPFVGGIGLFIKKLT